jgi:predicted ATP-grasp superfamily ATP-dependent carboligase
MKNKADQLPYQPPKGRVIVTYGRSLMALTMAHSLNRQGIEVIGCDDVDLTVMAFSRQVKDTFRHAPALEDPERFLDDLEENIRRFMPDSDIPYVLMPTFRETNLIAQHKERLEKLIRVATPSFEAISAVTPKHNLAITAKRIGASAPETLQPRTTEELLENIGSIRYPVLVKPVDDIGGRGIAQADDRGMLVSLFAESLKNYGMPPIVQEKVGGRDYCLTVLCQDGEIRASMAYKNIYTFPREAGAGIMRETVDDSMFIDAAAPLFRELRWNGVAEIDYRWDEMPGGKPWLIEVNTRFWAGLFHSVETGIDFPWLLYNLAAYGSVPAAGPAHIGGRTKVAGLWLLSAVPELFARKVGLRYLFRQLMDLWDEGKEAKNELDFRDDPLAGMGVLFVLSSLLRYGRLPPELTYK